MKWKKNNQEMNLSQKDIIKMNLLMKIIKVKEKVNLSMQILKMEWNQKRNKKRLNKWKE